MKVLRGFGVKIYLGEDDDPSLDEGVKSIFNDFGAAVAAIEAQEERMEAGCYEQHIAVYLQAHEDRYSDELALEYERYSDGVCSRCDNLNADYETGLCRLCGGFNL